MEKHEFYNVSFSEAIVRYLVMMAVIIAAVFSGWAGLALLALPLFLTALIGHCPIKKMISNSKKTIPAGRAASLNGESTAAAKAA